MKKLLLLILVIPLALVSCKKDDDDDLVLPTPYDQINVAQKQEAFVLLSTATWCGYCGEWGIPAFEGAFSGSNGVDSTRVNGVALHYSSSDPMYNSLSATIKTAMGIGGPPNLWIEFDNSYNLSPSGWSNAIKTRQNQTAPACGVGLYSKYSGGKYTVYVKVKYFSTMSGTYNLALYAFQNGVVNGQDINDVGTDPAYIHNRVLRAEVTNGSTWGTQLFSGTSPTADFTATYSYTPPTSIQSTNIHFVAVIYEMNSGSPVATINSNSY